MSLVFVSPILHSEALGARLLDAFFVVARMTIMALYDVIKLERKERISRVATFAYETSGTTKLKREESKYSGDPN